MLKKLAHRYVALLPAACCLVGSANADYLDDIGYTDLAAAEPALGDGTGIVLLQVEASSAPKGEPVVYFPDTSDPDLSSTVFIDGTGAAANGTSSHATSMARRITGPMSPGVSPITVFETVDWINSVLDLGSDFPPGPSDRLANHSWAGDFADITDVEILERLDFQADTYEVINVVGMNHDDPLLSAAYNIIAVNRTGPVANGALPDLGSFYPAGRARPHLVVPVQNSSLAAAVTTSAVALLRDNAPVQVPRPETMKAVLMAAADRRAENSDGTAITDYRGTPQHQTINGLDTRYGAGQLNVERAYRIFQGGGHPSLEDFGGPIPDRGYHYDFGFGGLGGSNATATYRFTTASDPVELTASLAWHVRVIVGGFWIFPFPDLVDLDLALYDVTGGTERELARSASTLDNTENVWAWLPGDRQYELRVTSKRAPNFFIDYALAWDLSAAGPAVAVPADGGALGRALLAAGILLVGAGRVRRTAPA